MFGLERRLLTVICTALLAGLWLGADTLAADGEQLPGTVAAVVDYQRVLQEASASQSIAEQMDVRRKAYQDEISKEEQRLYEAEKTLAKQRSGSVLSEEALKAKQIEFETEVANVRELTQKRRQQLDDTTAQAVSEVERALFEVLTTIAEERGFNVVLPTSQVLFFSRQIDLTDEVLVMLDARLPQVAVTDRVD